MDFDTIDTDMWSEIADMPGEIFDLSDEDREEMAKVFAMSEEEYYKLNKDPRFGVFSDSSLWRKGDYKLYRQELRDK